MRVVLISLDGAFLPDLEKWKQTAHIGRLIKGGVYTDHMRTVYPALTYPAHTSMMTGLHPIDHGIGHNQPFDAAFPSGALLDEMRPWHWDVRDIKAQTMFDRLYQKGKTCAAILWPITGKSKAIKYLFPEVLALPGEHQAIKMLRYGNPCYILSTELRYGRRRKSQKEPHLSDYATLLAVKLLEKKCPPDLIALHLVDLDAMRHRYGVFSKEADAAMERLDRRVGEILTVLDRRNLWRDTCVMLVSDHGQKDVLDFISLDAAFQKAHLPAHAQSFGTGAAIHLDKPDYALKTAAFLHKNKKELRIKAIFDRQALDAYRAALSYSLCVEGEEGVAYVDCHEGARHEKATHGFPPDDPAGNCLLVLYGAGGFDGRVKGALDVTHVGALVEDIVQKSGDKNAKCAPILP